MPRKSKGPFLRWRKDRNVFEIIHHTGGKRIVHSTGSADSAVAEKALAEYILNKPSGRVGPCHPHERSIADVLADYLTKHAVHTTSVQTAAHNVDILLRFFGRSMAGDIRTETIRAYIEHRKKERAQKTSIPLSMGTVRRELTTLAAALSHDWKAGNITQLIYVWKPSPAPGKDRWLTRQEAASLIRAARQGAARSYLPLFILIGLYTSARKEAILTLRWSQVDLKRGLIDFNPPGRVKTSKGRSLIPIPDRLLTFLKYAKRRGTDLGYVLHINQKPIGDIKKGFRLACDRAGLKGVTPHTLRHTSISWMVQGGVELHEAGRYAGHSTVKMTERYAHLSPKHLKAAADSFRRGK